MKNSTFALAALLTIFVVGCGNSSSSEDTPGGKAGIKTPPGGSAKKTYVVGVSQCNLGEPYRAQMNKDLEDAAKDHPELKLVFKDAQNDSLKQRSQVEEFVQDKVDFLIISPKEAQPLTEPVAKAFDAGIPVVVLDRALMGDKFTMFIGADNKEIGKAAGKWLVKKLNGTGNIVELKGLMTSTPAQDRHNGFREGIAGAKFNIVFESEMKWLEPEARKEMDSALARAPKIDAVYAHNDPGAHGAYLAAKAASRDKGVIFIGIDSLPQEGQGYVKQGILAASFQYPTGGKEGIQAVLDLIAGKKTEKTMVLKSRVFTPENVDKGGDPLE